MTRSARLPRTVVPRRYALTVAPDLDAGTFAGEIVIRVDARDAADTVTLHAAGLDVEVVEVSGRPATLTTDADHEQITLHVDRPLEPGEHALRLRFRGTLHDDLVGFYRSTYTDDAGRERVLAATQFEAPHARRAFPCFDEPDLKAVFEVTLVVAEGLCALSNSAEIAREPAGDGRVRIRYAPTIPMSTYLVAFVVGPLELTDPVVVDGVPLRVAHVPGRGHLTRFALDVGAFAVRFFGSYYGIPYPGQKLDLVALPDFAFGAMENLGCVTFRESRLLVDVDTVTVKEASDTALTIVHEIAHMWFGDLVTMKWWNGIWLNEAFATFMEHAGVDAYRPDWRTWDDFAIGRAAAMNVDALSSTRPVEYEVKTPEDADGMFDTLTYQKGGSVVRMLERWLGEEAFRAGVRLYLDRFKLGNTETTDLWDAIEEATAQPVRRIMDSWIFQPGFPAIVAERDETGVRVSQRRFSFEAVDGGARWPVPVLARVGGEQRALLVEDPVHLDVGRDTPVVLNAGGEGFYRVAYPREWRDQLVDSGALTPLERFAVVDDLWASVVAGDASAHELVALARRLGGETDLVVWRVLLGHLREVARLVDGDTLARLRDEVAELVNPVLSRLGWDASDGEDARTRQLRGVLVDALGTLACDAAAIARARDIAARPHAVDADVAAACVVVVASVGDDDDFATYVARFHDAATPQEQLRYLYALGDFPTGALVLRAVGLAASDEVRSQNAPFVLQRALRNREHGPAAWVFVRDRWDALVARFPRTLVARMLEGVTWLIDDVSAADVPRFLAAHPVPEGARVIAQHVERQRVHRALFEREHDRLAAALRRG